MSRNIYASLTMALAISLLPAAANAQDSLRYDIEVRASLSGGENTPFWLANNLQGLGSPRTNSGFVKAGLFRDIDNDRRFSWGAGVSLAGAWRNTSPFYVHELYGEVKYRSLDALLGSKVIKGDFNNPRLSSGNLLYSGNALPIPQLRLGIFDYAPFWGTDGWLSAKGYIAYGMFTDSRWQKSWSAPDSRRTEDALYHSKGLWLRGGDPGRFPLVGEIGIEMATQFGGHSYKDGKRIDMGHGFKKWWHAFFPHSGKEDTHLGDAVSTEGNMLGTYDFSLSWLPDADWSVKAYYQHYFEDQSQMTFEYGWKDGLWGIEAQLPANRVVSAVVVEYLYSKDQTGAVFNNSSPEIPEQISGRDEYYNHFLYSGWQHWGMGIGNPLIISPLYNRDHDLWFRSTRIEAWHLGLEGSPRPDLGYRMLLSYSRNWGTYTKPLPEMMHNFNALLEVSWRPERLRGWEATLGVAGDTGRLLGKSFGAALTISKTGWLNF